MSTMSAMRECEPHIPRDRRASQRFPVNARSERELVLGYWLTDISADGVGFLAPRHDAALLQDAVVLVNVDGAQLMRAKVKRVDLGGTSEEWVRVGAHFVDRAAEERESLRALCAG